MTLRCCGEAPVTDFSGPKRSPLACGGLVPTIAGSSPRSPLRSAWGLRIAHEDGNSMLALDRDPLRWHGDGQRGLAWIEGAPWRGGAASVAGGFAAKPLGSREDKAAWIEDGRAVYFASRGQVGMAAPAPEQRAQDRERFQASARRLWSATTRGTASRRTLPRRLPPPSGCRTSGWAAPRGCL